MCVCVCVHGSSGVTEMKNDTIPLMHPGQLFYHPNLRCASTGIQTAILPNPTVHCFPSTRCRISKKKNKRPNACIRPCNFYLAIGGGHYSIHTSENLYTYICAFVQSNEMKYEIHIQILSIFYVCGFFSIFYLYAVSIQLSNPFSTNGVMQNLRD